MALHGFFLGQVDKAKMIKVVYPRFRGNKEVVKRKNNG